MIKIRQFIPQEFCLKCEGCCRFASLDSAWAPCLLDEEIQDYLDKNNLPPALISIDRRIQPIPNPGKDNFICAFFNLQENKCKIYEIRPFECQLYPFLISLRHKKVFLTVDLNCPYIKEKIDTAQFKEYVEYLGTYLNQPAQLRMLKDNSHLVRAYEEVLEVVELRLPDET
jgi:hypothetical protein